MVSIFFSVSFGVSMVVIIMTFSMLTVIAMVSIIFSILLFTELIGLIPRSFYEYLERGIEMYDKDIKHKAQ
jgi:hypothetical protein